MFKYFGSFTSKYGFGDGDNLPDDVEDLWEELEDEMNAALSEAGITDVRAVRCYFHGVHNPYRIELYDDSEGQFVSMDRPDVKAAFERYNQKEELV